MRTTCLTIIAGLLASVCSTAQYATAVRQLPLIILAGQSNAVGFDANPTELPTSIIDQQILFWWKCGDPPPDEHDSAGRRWTHLQPQPLGNPITPRRDRQYGNYAQPEGGFGPEIGLARRLYTSEHRPFAVIKVAFSGTGIGRDWDPHSDTESGACFRALLSEIAKAEKSAKQKQIQLQPRAFVWVQGESDANAMDAPLYAERFKVMLTAIRKELNTPQLPALLAVNTRFHEGRNEYMPRIVEAQQQFAESDPHSVYVDTASASIANAVHYDAKGTLLVGELIATELLKLEQSAK